MVHGCRQLVSWDVRLSPATSATLILSYYHLVEHSKETARVIGRKVGTTSNHHASYEWGLHTCYNGRYKEKRSGDMEQTSKNRSQFGLKSATRLHEVGIASNRRISYATVNTFSGLVHTARQTMGAGNARSRFIKKLPKAGLVTGVKS